MTTAALSVVADNASRDYGATNPAFSGTLTGIRNSDNITATYTSTATPASPVGSYPIIPTLADPTGKLANYAVTTNNGTLTVTPAVLTGTADAKSRLYGAANPPFTATYSGFVNGQNASIVTGTLSGSTPATTNSPVGSYPISVGGQSAPNYTLQYVAGTLTVLPTPLLVRGEDASRAYGQTNPPLTASLSGWVNGEGIPALGGALVVSSPAQTNSPVGSYPIIPTGLTSTNYALTFSNGTLTVTAYALSVTADNQSRAYGATNPVLTGSLVGLRNGDNITAVYTTGANTNSGVGPYPITVSLLDPDGKLANYAVTTNNGTLNVTTAALSVTADNASRSYGAPNPPFTGTIIGVQNGDNITATYATVATQTSPVGTYSIVPSVVDPGGRLANYAVTLNNGTLTIAATTTPVILSILPTDKTTVVITWTSVSNSVYRVQYKANLASTNWISLAPDVIATSSTTSFTDYPAGASQRYYRILFVSSEPPTLPVIQSIVGAGTPNVVITWSAVSNRVYRVQYKANLAATSWFNLAPDVTATGSTASFTDHPGTASPRYYRVVLLSAVTPLTPLVVVANNASRGYGATNPVFSGTLTGVQAGDNINATYSTTATTSSSVGSYPIIPTLVDPNGKLENYLVSITNGTLTVTKAVLTVTANNASRPYGTANPTFTGIITGIQNGDNITALYTTGANTNSGVGPYPITVSLLDPDGKLANYAVTTNNGTLNVTTAALSVTADNASRSYGAPNPPFTGTIIGVQNGDNITATYATVATQTSPVGTYSIVPSVVDPGGRLANYAVTLNNGTLTIAATTTPVILSILPTDKTTVVITWTSVSNSVYRVQYKANLASTNWISLAPDVIATSSTTSFTDYPAGASQRYYRILFVSSEPPTLPVIQSIVGAGTPNVVITWSAVSNRVYRVQYKANLAATSWFNLAPDVTATGSTASFTDHPGTASPRYYRVVLLSAVTPLTPLVVVANNASRGYGATNPVFSGTLTGVQAGDNINATYSTTATTSSSVGSYPIIPTLVDPNGKLENYLVSITNGTLTVTKAVLTVTANNASRPYGTANPTFTGIITGIQNGDNITATYSTTATVSSPPGTYPIVPTLADPGNKLPNYAVTLNNGMLTVTAPTAPSISSIVRSPGNTNVTITWPSVSNSVYRVQYKTNLASPGWFSLAPDVTATGSTASFPDHPGTAPQRFYRVVLLSGVDPLQTVFYDDFMRPADPGAMSPWITQSGPWTVTGGVLKGGPNPVRSYAFASLATNWTDYSVEARLQFPAGAYGGGLGGRLNPATGAHYAAWIYPEGSLGGSGILRLIKFQTWTSFGYTNTSFVPMQQVSLAQVGTNWHTLKLVFFGNRITVSFDGNQLISATDVEATSYARGGVGVGMWTETTPYLMAVDDVLVNSLVTAQTPATLGIKGNGDGTVIVTLAGTPGAQYVVQTATNLASPVTWVNMATNTAGADGRWTLTDSTTSGTLRFYRGVLLP